MNDRIFFNLKQNWQFYVEQFNITVIVVCTFYIYDTSIYLKRIFNLCLFMNFEFKANEKLLQLTDKPGNNEISILMQSSGQITTTST